MRTGWISFAAVLAGIAGAYNIISGLAALTADEALKQRAEAIFNINLTPLGWLWLILGIVQVLTAVWIWQRHPLGLIFGVIWAGVSAGLTVLVIFTYPLWAVLVMSIQLAILFGLLGHAHEFE